MSQNLQVKNLSIIKKNINETKELKEIFDSMVKNGIENPMNLLPTSPWYEMSFRLSNTYSGFANGIRRVLMEEIPTKCLDFNENNYETDDEFILIDKIQKDINLIPINQDFDEKEINKYTINLYKYNKSNKIIDVKASDIDIIIDSKSNRNTIKLNYNKNNSINIKKLIPDPNIIISVLRPGKFISIKKFTLVEGLCKNDASKFSLLDDVTYKPIVENPFDSLKHKGTRSIQTNPTEFDIKISTASNISILSLTNKLCNVIINKLKNAKHNIEEYIKSEEKSDYYSDNFEVHIYDNIKKYKFHGEYITLSYMLAQRCYLLDKNILFCTPSVDRFDTEIAIIKLKHPDSDNLLISACDECVKDIEILRTEIKNNTQKIK